MIQNNRKQHVCLAAGLGLAIIVWNLGLDMTPDGKRCLALSLMAVVWWATKAMDAGMISMALMVSYVLLLDGELVTPAVVFSIWTTPTIYLVIGGFLISEAIQNSGLGERVSCYFIKLFVKSFKSVIIACYILGALLSLMIPHPWPRSFLLLSVMANVIKTSRVEKKYAMNIGLAIFAGSIPTSMILITGDSTLNPAVAGFAGTTISWGQWALWMGVPGILMTILTCTVQLFLFKGPNQFELDQHVIQEKINVFGNMKWKEKGTVCIMVLAIVLWMSDSVHGIHSGWIAAGAAILLASPLIGVLSKDSWKAVNISTLLFLGAALSIGTVGKITGMNEWIARVLIPESLSSNPYVFALVTCFICMAMHMLLGSTLAVLGIAAPAIISFGITVGISPLVSAMLSYTAVCMHWLLPFHHMNLLVGVGEQGGGYTEKETIAFGIVQTAIVIIICMTEIFWWSILGIL